MRLILPLPSFIFEILLRRISSLLGIRIANLFRNYLIIFYYVCASFSTDGCKFLFFPVSPDEERQDTECR